MIDTDPPLILDAVALRRSKPRPDGRFLPRDIAQWWLYPPSTRLRREVVAVGQLDLDRMPMFAEVLPLLGSRDRQDLQARLVEWQRRGLPERHTDHGCWPVLGFLIERGVATIACTPGHHPWHQMWNGFSPFWKAGPLPVVRVAQLQRMAVMVPGYQSGTP
jgi:hypothetical protein